MARSKKKATSALPTVSVNDGREEVEQQPKRSNRKRKQVSYVEVEEDFEEWVEENSKPQKSKNLKATKTTSKMSTLMEETADTSAASTSESPKLEDPGPVKVEVAPALARVKRTRVSVVEAEQEENPKKKIRKGKSIVTKSATMNETVEAEVVPAPEASKLELPMKTEDAPALALISTVMGTQDAPFEISESPVRVVRKIIPKKKGMRRLKTMSNEMAVDEDGEEVRKKEYLERPDAKYEAKKMRALSQPIRVISRERCDTDDVPMEKYTMEGSVGNSYTVDFRYVPTCTCQDYIFRRKPCKHIIYIIHKVLKISDPLAYQEAYLSSELREIFNNAPSAPFVEVEKIPGDPKRKAIEGECPICYMEFKPDQENIDYCKAACGNNVHSQCMESWLKSQRKTYHKATCPYCRHDWAH